MPSPKTRQSQLRQLVNDVQNSDLVCSGNLEPGEVTHILLKAAHEMDELQRKASKLDKLLVACEVMLRRENLEYRKSDWGAFRAAVEEAEKP